MKNVKLKVYALVDDRNHAPGDVVSVTDERAAALKKADHAEDHDDAAEPANPGTNPLADAIQPCPPGGAVLNPVDAVAPVVADNPGLVKLAEASEARARSSKTKGGKAGPVVAETTADELVPSESPKAAGPPKAPEAPKAAEGRPATTFVEPAKVEPAKKAE